MNTQILHDGRNRKIIMQELSKDSVQNKTLRNLDFYPYKEFVYFHS